MTFAPRQGCRPWPACRPTYKGRKPIAIHSMPHSGDGLLPLHCRRFGPLARPRRGMGTPALGLSSCSKLIAIKLCAISEMHAKVRRESVAGYATDETLKCGPKEHTRWWQRYSGHLQGLLYRLILNSYLLIRHNDCILQAFMPVAPCVPQALRPAPRESENRGAWPWNLCAWASNRANAANGIGALRPGGNVTGHANACMLKPASLRRTGRKALRPAHAVATRLTQQPAGLLQAGLTRCARRA